MTLDELRRRIDELDQQLVGLLRARAEISREIGQVKSAEGRPVYDPRREAQLLDNLTGGELSPLHPAAVRAIYQEILSASRSLQRRVSVAYLGPEYTFSHRAATGHFGHSCEFLPQPSIDDVFAAAERGNADYGVVPIENSIQGVETRTLDAFVNSPLKICGETVVEVHICLLASGETSQIRRVDPHPQPLAQCRSWLREHLPNAELVPVSSTAAAAEAAAASGDPAEAALANAQAGHRHGLTTLAENIEDRPNNQTRFFVIGYTDAGLTGKDKTSVLFSTKHHAGALYSALAPLSAHQINMTLIQSRPSPSSLEGPHIFYVDFEGHQADPQVSEALEELRNRCQTLKVLGSYSSAS